MPVRTCSAAFSRPAHVRLRTIVGARAGLDGATSATSARSQRNPAPLTLPGPSSERPFLSTCAFLAHEVDRHEPLPRVFIFVWSGSDCHAHIGDRRDGRDFGRSRADQRPGARRRRAHRRLDSHAVGRERRRAQVAGAGDDRRRRQLRAGGARCARCRGEPLPDGQGRPLGGRQGQRPQRRRSR